MDKLLNKLLSLEKTLAEEKGSFYLFGLFLREDAEDKWDLVVCAPWIGQEKEAALRYMSKKLANSLTADEMVSLSRIVVIDPKNPAVRAMASAMKVEHGSAEVKESVFFGLRIKHAYIITSRKPPNGNKRAKKS